MAEESRKTDALLAERAAVHAEAIETLKKDHAQELKFLTKKLDGDKMQQQMRSQRHTRRSLLVSKQKSWLIEAVEALKEAHAAELERPQRSSVETRMLRRMHSRRHTRRSLLVSKPRSLRERMQLTARPWRH